MDTQLIKELPPYAYFDYMLDNGIDLNEIKNSLDRLKIYFVDKYCSRIHIYDLYYFVKCLDILRNFKIEVISVEIRPFKHNSKNEYSWWSVPIYKAKFSGEIPEIIYENIINYESVFTNFKLFNNEKTATRELIASIFKLLYV